MASQDFLTSKGQIPFRPPPDGIVSNFVDPPSQRSAMVAICTILIIFTLTFVMMRLYSNFFINKSQGAEDYFCISATVSSFAYMAVILHPGYVTRHSWDVPYQWLFGQTYWKLSYAQSVLQAFAFAFARLSGFLLFIRLFGRNKAFRYAAYLGIVAACLVCVSYVVIFAYYCTPRPNQDWTSLGRMSRCASLMLSNIVLGSCNMALDVYTLILPLPMIWALSMPLARRIGVIAIFTTASFAVIASATSFYYRYQLTYGNDLNWNEGAYIVCVAVEINIVIICSSMPACSSFFKHIFQKSDLLASIRSAFRHFKLSSSNGSLLGNRKFRSHRPSSYEPESTEFGTIANSHSSGVNKGYEELAEGTFVSHPGQMGTTVGRISVVQVNEPSRVSQPGKPRKYDIDVV